MHRLVMTFMKYKWEDDCDDPIIDSGYYEPYWGEWSDYKDEDLTIHWDKDEIQSRRDASMVDVEPDEFDIDDDITLAQNAADFIEEWGCNIEMGSGWFEGEPHVVDYSQPWDRRFSIHFVDEDWSEQEKDDVVEELLYREAMRDARSKSSREYFNSVKAIV